MAKKNMRNTKGRIIEAAWRLFYRQGYDDTTVEEIIEESGTSRGSSYHYFEGKDALLSTVSYLFDQKYEALMETMDPEMDRFDQLDVSEPELFAMIENSVSLTAGPSSIPPAHHPGDKHLLDHNRIYYRLLRQIVLQGQERGELRRDVTVSDGTGLRPVRAGSDLRLVPGGGDYSLQSGTSMMPRFFRDFRTEK